jgi:hypothetical protein
MICAGIVRIPRLFCRSDMPWLTMYEFCGRLVLWVPFCPGPRGALDRDANTAKGAGAVGAVSAGVRRLTSRTARARGPGVALEWA